MAKSVDYQRIKVELLIALRGEYSQTQASELLGYSYNQVRRWEQLTKQCRWDEFCGYCHKLAVPLDAVTSWVLLPIDGKSYSKLIVTNYLMALRARFPEMTLEQLAKKLNTSVSVLKRYIHGDIFPDLEFVLAFLDLKQNWLSQFVYELLEDRPSPYLRSYFAKDQKKVDAKLEQPLSAAVECCLDLASYKQLPLHSDSFIADKVGCTAKDVQIILKSMCQVGTTILNKDGKYVPNFQTINTECFDRKKSLRALQFWTQRSLMRLQDDEPISRGPVPSATAYRVAPASINAMRKIREIIIRANDEIINALEQDDNPTQDVQIVLMHAFSATDVV